METPIDWEEVIKQIGKIGIAVGAIIFSYIVGVVGAAFAKKQMGNDEWKEYYKNNFPLLAALPMAVVAAFGIAVYFDVATSGPIEVSFWGLKFKGPAAPVVLWTLVFMAIVFAIRVLATAGRRTAAKGSGADLDRPDASDRS